MANEGTRSVQDVWRGGTVELYIGDTFRRYWKADLGIGRGIARALQLLYLLGTVSRLEASLCGYSTRYESTQPSTVLIRRDE